MIESIKQTPTTSPRSHLGRTTGARHRANRYANLVPVRGKASVADLLMLLSDWSSGDGPLYRRLADRINVLIDERALEPETFLPSERALAAALSVSRRTVEAAYDLLWTRQLVRRKTGVGTWCAQRHPLAPADSHRCAAAEEFIEHLLDASRALDLTIAGMPAHPLMTEARQATRSVVEAMQFETHGYLPLGLDLLREEICKWFIDRGVPTEPGQLALTTGASQGLWLASSLLAPGTEVWLENPTSPTILNALRGHALRLREVPIDQHGMQIDAIPPDARGAVVVTPCYLNPTGAHLEEARCRKLAQRADRDLLVIEDLALADINLDGPAPRSVAAYASQANILSIGSVSKLFWGGLRLGWMRGPTPLIRRINHLRAKVDISTSVDVQAQAAWLLRHRPEVARDRLPQLRAQRDAALAELAVQLPEWRRQVPEGGLSIWLELPGEDASMVCQRALRQGIRLLTGRVFDLHGRDERHLRLPFVRSVPIMREIVRRVATAARGRKASNDT